MNEYTMYDALEMEDLNRLKLKSLERAWLLAAESYAKALSAHIETLQTVIETSVGLDAADRALKEHRAKMKSDLIEAGRKLWGEEDVDD